MGWLARKYGLSTDSVNRFELITASGEMVNASATENPDLFWGLRGGGGNFGVVTGMEIRLYPVTTVYGGNLFYPIHKAKEVYAHYRRWIAWGLLVAAATGAGSWLLGQPFLTSSYDYPVLPLVGAVPLASASLFDLGVFLTVVGGTMVMLTAIGRLRSAPGTGPS